MADEKNISSISSVNDWVEAYYGFDGLDYSKNTKIKHVHHTVEFGSVCYLVTKNSKKAHTDFFEGNYTTLTNRVGAASELILKLMYIKFNENRALTSADFAALEGDLFKGQPNHDQIVEDYIGPGGMVDICQNALPIYSDNSQTAANIKEINDDIGNVRRDHEKLLAMTGKTDAASLDQKDLFGMMSKVTECAQKIWHEQKGAKSKAEKELQKHAEEAFYKRDDLALKTTKMAMVAGGAVACAGAVIGGVFWPAILLIPAWKIGKNWAKDWAKAAGAMWGNYKLRYKDRRDINRAVASQHYIQSFAQYGAKGALRNMSLKDRLYLRGADITILKKQAKQVCEALDIENLDEKMMVSKNTEIQQAMSRGLGNLTHPGDGEGLVPADQRELLLNKVKGFVERDDTGKVVKVNATMDDLRDFISQYNKWKDKLPEDAKNAVMSAFKDNMVPIFEQVLFNTKMEDLTYVSNMTKELKDDSEIMKFVMECGETPETKRVKNYASFASKELTGLGGEASDLGLTLEGYITKEQEPRLDASSPELSGFVDPTDAHLVNVIGLISNIEMKDEHFHSGTKTVEEIAQEISKISNNADRAKANAALNDQIGRVRRLKMRELSMITLDELRKGTFNGKLDGMAEAFKGIGEIKYDTINTISQLYTDIGKFKPSKTAEYIKVKFRKKVFDVFDAYSKDNVNDFKSDITKAAEFLKKVNMCAYIDDGQKRELTLGVEKLLPDALTTSIEQLKFKLMNDSEAGKFFDSVERLDSRYANGGIKEATENNKKLQEQVDYLNLARDYKTVLEMKNGDKSFAWIDPELKFVTKTLFENGKVRKEDDFLRNFISVVGNIEKNSYNLTGNVYTPSEIASGGTFAGIRDALQKIEDAKIATPKPTDDELVAAYLVLKNKAVSLLHQFMENFRSQLLTKYSGKTFDNIVIDPAARTEIYGITGQWNTLLGEIDNAITSALNPGGPAPRENKSKAKDNISRYEGDASKWNGGYGMGS